MGESWDIVTWPRFCQSDMPVWKRALQRSLCNGHYAWKGYGSSRGSAVAKPSVPRHNFIRTDVAAMVCHQGSPMAWLQSFLARSLQSLLLTLTQTWGH